MREGLPAGYRMRADPHYRATLSRPRADRPAAQPAPAAIGGTFQAMCACVDRRGSRSAVAMRVTSLRERAARGIDVVQTAVRISPSILGRLFEADWAEHPAGPTGAVFLAAARRIASLQGGTLDVRAVGGGCRLVLTLPAAE